MTIQGLPLTVTPVTVTVLAIPKPLITSNKISAYSNTLDTVTLFTGPNSVSYMREDWFRNCHTHSQHSAKSAARLFSWAFSFLTDKELKYIVEPPGALKTCVTLRTRGCVRYVDVHTELTERGEGDRQEHRTQVDLSTQKCRMRHQKTHVTDWNWMKVI